jgi:hypothetical protein
MKPKLFLLKPDFVDANLSDVDSFFCPYGAFIEGILHYYPHLREELEIQYLDFQRPRLAIVEFLGEDFQLAPSLVVDYSQIPLSLMSRFQTSNGHYFTDDNMVIAQFLSMKYGIAQVHP